MWSEDQKITKPFLSVLGVQIRIHNEFFHIPDSYQRFIMMRIRHTGSVADPDPVGSGPFSRIRIRSNFPDPDPVPDPDPTIKSHITRSKSNKLNRYFCEQFTFF